MTAGSSPHARGLPSRLRWTRLTRRIIPACAGFTRSRTLSPLLHADHPRMRGVYFCRRRPPPGPEGSSPHARGLLPALRRLQAHRGIIPACAGFTEVDVPARTIPQDHPRMRGVYALSIVSAMTSRGSSPHARGLRRSGKR